MVNICLKDIPEDVIKIIGNFIINENKLPCIKSENYKMIKDFFNLKLTSKFFYDLLPRLKPKCKFIELEGRHWCSYHNNDEYLISEKIKIELKKSDDDIDKCFFIHMPHFKNYDEKFENIFKKVCSENAFWTGQYCCNGCGIKCSIR